MPQFNRGVECAFGVVHQRRTVNVSDRGVASRTKVATSEFNFKCTATINDK